MENNYKPDNGEFADDEEIFLYSLCEKIAKETNCTIEKYEINQLYKCINMNQWCQPRIDDCRIIFKHIKCIVQYIVDTKQMYPSWIFKNVSVVSTQDITMFYFTFQSYDDLTYYKVGNNNSMFKIEVSFDEEDIKLMDNVYHW
jgi:hypothetical protein